MNIFGETKLWKHVEKFCIVYSTFITEFPHGFFNYKI